MNVNVGFSEVWSWKKNRLIWENVTIRIFDYSIYESNIKATQEPVILIKHIYISWFINTAKVRSKRMDRTTF